MDLVAKSTAEVLGPDGTPINKPATLLENDEAQLLRDYQAFGEREQLQGVMCCNSCEKQMEVYVQAEIGFFCECRVLFWKAS